MVSPENWKPLTIQYGINIIGGVSYICWKVTNTEKIFRIPSRLVYENHGLDFGDHFSLVLRTFYQDYKSWEQMGFPADWMKNYQQQFENLIL